MDELELILESNPLDCGACKKCCQNNPGILLLSDAGDDPSLYEGGVDFVDGQPILKRKANGDCVYLDSEKGCTIYEKRPQICRSYDCRRDYMRWISLSRQERRMQKKSGQLNPLVQKEGGRRLEAVFESSSGRASRR
ncbi:MAG: YkgJ family cysteine cluster protein [Parvibaculaceae bacterium]|nr:YkgJ family cysteine cluster protein [Kangiella sp.]